MTGGTRSKAVCDTHAERELRDRAFGRSQMEHARKHLASLPAAKRAQLDAEWNAKPWIDPVTEAAAHYRRMAEALS